MTYSTDAPAGQKNEHDLKFYNN